MGNDIVYECMWIIHELRARLTDYAFMSLLLILFQQLYSNDFIVKDTSSRQHEQTVSTPCTVVKPKLRLGKKKGRKKRPHAWHSSGHFLFPQFLHAHTHSRVCARAEVTRRSARYSSMPVHCPPIPLTHSSPCSLSPLRLSRKDDPFLPQCSSNSL